MDGWACGAESTPPDEDEAGAMLDLETLTAETEAGTMQAQRAGNSYAGQIEEGRVIAAKTPTLPLIGSFCLTGASGAAFVCRLIQAYAAC
jgi:hypothetical protein